MSTGQKIIQNTAGYNIGQDMRKKKTEAEMQKKLPPKKKQSTTASTTPMTTINTPQVHQANAQANNQVMNRFNQLTAQNMGSSKPIVPLDESKKESTRNNWRAWLGDKTKLGAERGFKGIPAAIVQETANAEGKGYSEKERIEKAAKEVEERTGSKLAGNIVRVQQWASSPFRMLSPAYNARNVVKEAGEIGQNEEATPVQKFTQATQTITSGAAKSNPLYNIATAPFQAFGAAKSKEELEQTQENASKASQELLKSTNEKAEKLAREGRKYNGVVQGLGNALESVGGQAPSIVAGSVTGNPRSSVSNNGSIC